MQSEDAKFGVDKEAESGLECGVHRAKKLSDLTNRRLKSMKGVIYVRLFVVENQSQGTYPVKQ